MRTTTIIAACALVITTIEATANQLQTNRRPRWLAPDAATSLQNPLNKRADTAAGGKKLFQQRCSVCHGDDGTGTDRGPDLSSTRVQRQSDGEVFWKISSGNTRTGMPTFSFLPRLQRWQLVQHVRSLTQPAQSTIPRSDTADHSQ